MRAPGLQGGGFMSVRAGWSLGGAFQNAFNPAAGAFVGRVSHPAGVTTKMPENESKNDFNIKN